MVGEGIRFIRDPNPLLALPPEASCRLGCAFFAKPNIFGVGEKELGFAEAAQPNLSMRLGKTRAAPVFEGGNGGERKRLKES
jgi:hypothetical protein